MFDSFSQMFKPTASVQMSVMENGAHPISLVLEHFSLMMYFIYSFHSGSETIVAVCPHFLGLKGNLCKEYRDKW